MCIADFDHRAEDRVPSLLVFQHRVGEHTSVPANVLQAAAGGALEPRAGCFYDVELPVGIVGGAVAAGFFVAAGAVDGAVVLGDMEVDRPGAEGIRHGFESGVELGGGVAGLEKGVFFGVDAEQVEISVGLVGLEADGFGHADFIEQVEHVFPGVHAGPADLPLSGEAFAVVLGDVGRFAEGGCDFFGVAFGVGIPVSGAVSRVDADDAVFADAVLLQNFGDAAGLLHGFDKVRTVFVGAHRGATDGARPHGSDEGAHGEAVRGDFVRHGADGVVSGIGIGVRVKEEEIDAVELLAVDLGSGCHLQHTVETDGRVVGARLFADEAGPHGVVKLGEIMG